MMYLKSCRKCHGDMYLNRDRYGAYLDCLQCGLMLDLVGDSPLMSQVKEREIERESREVEARLDAILVEEPA